ncbi:hypothetical protein [Acinetobacter populi]|uniref:Uncharacterized protein n=1 Tax=Acinetobacter populi TaxID=1582270 RepID=A0A1Z9Z2N9_9GAMM|nr:hypothetical protein [Acinetobacter populi]OUY08724.1 hypothetical protein CAP51_03675 [Acinetobacter populi]
MAESPAENNRLRQLEERKAFEELRDKVIQELKVLIEHPVFHDIKEMHLLGESTFTDINNISVIFKNILVRIEKEYDFIASEWILKILKSEFYNIRVMLDLLLSGIKNFRVYPKNNFIGYGDEKRSFAEFSEFILARVKYLEHLNYYLSALYDGLKREAQQVTLMANNDFVRKIESTRNDLVKEVEDFRRLRNNADNAKTENIYNNAVVKYRKYEWGYRIAFFLTLALVFGVSLWFWNSDYLNNIINQPSYASSAIFWSVKITSLIACITLLTYFLKQSSHHQKLADQNYQTQLELQAYPSFMESIPTEEAASVRKELALKYFGREVDGAAHKDMSNLISDQMKSTTDMVKATTEAIKNLKG